MARTNQHHCEYIMLNIMNVIHIQSVHFAFVSLSQGHIRWHDIYFSWLPGGKKTSGDNCVQSLWFVTSN